MTDLDRRIDALYQSPPAAFTGARNALAKTVSGAEASRIRQLKKPTAVPWAVSQVFWKARSVYDRVVQRGKALRAAQIATIKGKRADVRAAAEAHRAAVAEAVHRAVELAGEAGLHPNTEQLARMVEAISLAATPPSEPGRLVEVVEPSGFEALAGVTPAARAREQTEEEKTQPAAAKADERRRMQEEQRRRKAQERERRKAEAELAKAERELERARAEVKTAEAAVARARART